MEIRDLDIALDYFYSNRVYNYFEEVHLCMQQVQSYTQIETQLLMQKLVRDGYVIEEPQVEFLRDTKTNKYGYFITFDGIRFHESGGYIAEIERAKKESLDASIARVLDLSLKRNQKSVNTVTSITGCISLLFIIVSVWFQATDKTDAELLELRKQLRGQQSTIKELNGSLREINLSIQQNIDSAGGNSLRTRP